MAVFIGCCLKDKDPKEAKTSLSVSETSSKETDLGRWAWAQSNRSMSVLICRRGYTRLHETDWI
jgi:hypothetical protein